MAVNVKKMFGGGIEYVFYGIRNGSGYFYGSTSASGPSTGATGEAMAQMTGVKTFPFQPIAPERSTLTGDDGAVGTMQYKPIELPAAEAEFSVMDLTFGALAMGLVADDIGDATMLLGQPTNVAYQDLIFLTVSQGKDHATGAAHYFGDLIFNAQAYYMGRQNRTEREDASHMVSITTNKSTKYPWGYSFTNAINGDVEAVYATWTKPYKPMMHVWLANASATTFNLSSSYPLAADTANNIQVWVNGAELTWAASGPTTGQFSADTTGSGSITLSAAGSANDVIIALYGWQ